MCRTLAKDFGKRGITVNTVSPGPVETPLFTTGKSEQALKMIASLHPPGRIGQPDDISPIVSMIASPDAGWLNGQNIMVNGVSARFSISHEERSSLWRRALFCESESHAAGAAEERWRVVRWSGLRRSLGGRARRAWRALPISERRNAC